MSVSRYKLLFDFIKTVLPSGYKVTFGTQEENKENTIGVFFQGGTPKNRVITDGSYLEHTVTVTFNINASKDYNFVLSCIDDLEGFIRTFNEVHNEKYAEEKSSVTVLYTELFGDINMLGFNGVGIPCFSINYIIHYY